LASAKLEKNTGTEEMSLQSSYLINHNNIRKEEVPLKKFLKHLTKQIPNCDGGFEFPYYCFSFLGMQKFLENLIKIANMTSESLFLDVGSGRGNTVFCVANAIKPIMSYGIEGDMDRYKVETVTVVIIVFFIYNFIFICLLDLGKH
jgi:hypothetical protein